MGVEVLECVCSESTCLMVLIIFEEVFLLLEFSSLEGLVFNVLLFSLSRHEGSDCSGGKILIRVINLREFKEGTVGGAGSSSEIDDSS